MTIGDLLTEMTASRPTMNVPVADLDKLIEEKIAQKMTTSSLFKYVLINIYVFQQIL
jgi:hypothetical protein